MAGIGNYGYGANQQIDPLRTLLASLFGGGGQPIGGVGGFGTRSVDPNSALMSLLSQFGFGGPAPGTFGSSALYHPSVVPKRNPYIEQLAQESYAAKNQPDLANLDPAAMAALSKIKADALQELQHTYNQNQNDLVNRLYAQGIEKSSPGSQLAGELQGAYGRALADLQAAAAQREIEARQFASQQALGQAQAELGGLGQAGSLQNEANRSAAEIAAQQRAAQLAQQQARQQALAPLLQMLGQFRQQQAQQPTRPLGSFAPPAPSQHVTQAPVSVPQWGQQPVDPAVKAQLMDAFQKSPMWSQLFSQQRASGATSTEDWINKMLYRLYGV